MVYIEVQKHWKYILDEDHVEATGIRIPYPIRTSERNLYIEMDVDGTMTIRRRYAWDGPSRPALHTKNFMTPSLVHDAGYQLIRLGLLGPSYREKFDDLLVVMAGVPGRDMSGPRQAWVRAAVGAGGGFAIKPRASDFPKRIEVF